VASLVTWIRAAELEFASNVAVVDGDRRLTYSEVADRSDRAANVLGETVGWVPANVALLVGNAAEAVELDVALVKAALGRVSLNPRLSNDERQYIIADSQARALVYDPEYADFAEFVQQQAPEVLLFETGSSGETVGPGRGYEAALAAASSSAPVIEQPLDTPSLIMYTSGTTGRPKGAVWTLASRTAAVTNMLLNELDRAASVGMVHAASVAHGSGSKVVPIFVRGGMNILMRHFEPKDFFALVDREKATTSFLVPSMVQMLVDEAERSGVTMSSMVQATYGGAKMPLPTIKAALRLFGPVFAQVYGSCEAPHPVLILPRHEHDAEDDRVLSSAGHRSLGASIRIGDTETLPHIGAVGELLVAGDHIFGGYWQDLEATAEAFSDGYYRTGDIAELLDGGFVEIVGRVKEMIISGGYNVYPAEVERVLLDYPGITGACVYGRSSQRWGEAVYAAITVEPGVELDTAKVIDTARVRLANYKVPKAVWVADAFPFGTTGKVQRSEVASKHPESISEA
jgi:acyl-CoA synthetase (AMP-forming)/AMP-acid ligase II